MFLAKNVNLHINQQQLKTANQGKSNRLHPGNRVLTPSLPFLSIYRSRAAEGRQSSCDGSTKVKRPREAQRFFGVVSLWLSLFFRGVQQQTGRGRAGRGEAGRDRTRRDRKKPAQAAIATRDKQVRRIRLLFCLLFLLTAFLLLDLFLFRWSLFQGSATTGGAGGAPAGAFFVVLFFILLSSFSLFLFLLLLISSPVNCNNRRSRAGRDEINIGDDNNAGWDLVQTDTRRR